MAMLAKARRKPLFNAIADGRAQSTQGARFASRIRFSLPLPWLSPGKRSAAQRLQ